MINKEKAKQEVEKLIRKFQSYSENELDTMKEVKLKIYKQHLIY